jgi:hypothetical protein
VFVVGGKIRLRNAVVEKAMVVTLINDKEIRMMMMMMTDVAFVWRDEREMDDDTNRDETIV